MRAALPLLILAAGAGATFWLVKGRNDVKPPPPPKPLPAVRVTEARLEDRALTVRVHGTVAPRTEMTLMAEIPGRVASASLEPGRSFAAGELLASIDPTDFRLALAQAESRTAAARLRLAQEEAEAKLARAELAGQNPDPLALREPQLAEARAALVAAEAAVEQARVNLSRTRILAPFAGRLRQRFADVGQYVTAGAPLARLYAVDAAEVRLPITLEDLAFLDLAAGPSARLSAVIGGVLQTWEGRIVRTESEVDPKTRMIHAVCRVDRPAEATPPLLVGLFVLAEIRGITVTGVVALPRSALRDDGTVAVVEKDLLRLRPVRLLRLEEETALIAGGLSGGEQVCIQPPDTAVEGLKVTIEKGP